MNGEEQRTRRPTEDQPPPLPWRAWDGELVEKVASENGLRPEEVAALEDAKHPLMREFIESLVPNLHHDEFKVYRRVSATIRLLAAAGRAVIVGRGGVFLTGELPHGVHVHLVAPLEHRVRHMVELLHVPHDEAARRVAEMDRNRAAFYRRHWPKHRIEPETFDLTLNAGLLTLNQMVACVMPLVRSAAARAAESVDAATDRSQSPRTLKAGVLN
jgi:cytidylate kinase